MRCRRARGESGGGRQRLDRRLARAGCRRGANVVHEPRRGYGSAYLAGFAVARGRYIVVADADGAYDLSEVPRFVDELDAGADLVIGSRLRGRIEQGAMPWLHRRVNPLLTGILNAFTRTRCRTPTAGCEPSGAASCHVSTSRRPAWSWRPST